MAGGAPLFPPPRSRSIARGALHEFGILGRSGFGQFLRQFLGPPAAAADRRRRIEQSVPVAREPAVFGVLLRGGFALFDQVVTVRIPLIAGIVVLKHGGNPDRLLVEPDGGVGLCKAVQGFGHMGCGLVFLHDDAEPVYGSQ